MRSPFTPYAVLSRLTTLLSALLVLFSLMASIAKAETIRFAPLPLENRETVVRQYRPMVLYLEKKSST